MTGRKLTQDERFHLFEVAYRTIISRPTWPDSTPPASDGSSKKVSKAFAVAVWAMALTRSATQVIEKEWADAVEREHGQAQGAPDPGGGDSGTPF